MPWTESELLELIKDTVTEFSVRDTMLDSRREFALGSAIPNNGQAPLLPKAYQKSGTVVMSRRISHEAHLEAAALAANQPQIRFAPHDSAREGVATTNSKAFTGFWFDQMQASGMTLSYRIKLAQMKDNYGVYYWYLPQHYWPDYPQLTDEKGKAAKGIKATQKYLADEKAYRKEAGFPLRVQALDSRMFYDRNDSAGMYIGIIREEIPILRLMERYPGLKNNNGQPSLILGHERGYPAGSTTSSGTPSGGSTWILNTIWTRDHCYYVCTGNAPTEAGRDSAIVKEFAHNYGQPPFAIVAGMPTESNRPEFRYLPALESLYEWDRHYNYAMTALGVAMDLMAFPRFYGENADGTLWLDPEGKPFYFSPDPEFPINPPPGVTMKQVKVEMGADLMKWLEMIVKEREDASPPPVQRGQAPGASSPAWAIRLLQAAGGNQREFLAQQDAAAIQRVCENIKRIITKEPAFKDGVYMPILEEGRGGTGLQQRELITPGALDGMSISVDLSSMTASERITKQQAGIELHLAGAIDYTTRQVEYVGDDDPEGTRLGQMEDKLWDEDTAPLIRARVRAILEQALPPTPAGPAPSAVPVAAPPPATNGQMPGTQQPGLGMSLDQPAQAPLAGPQGMGGPGPVQP